MAIDIRARPSLAEIADGSPMDSDGFVEGYEAAEKAAEENPSLANRLRLLSFEMQNWSEFDNDAVALLREAANKLEEKPNPSSATD